ncbi:hypothetical protein ACFOLC_02625 [Lysobacter cavernae]|uniref:Uncharacterized protein n=1 Tax=Lysobacter cavernae TaxID=1685901 RepID=A0ABV7RMD7_9GAMM
MNTAAPDPACACGCRRPEGATVHAIVAALGMDDLDCALELGLLDVTDCPGCTPPCRTRLADARQARLRALAARERYRARQARLQRRALEKSVQRETTAAPATATGPAVAAPLPSAAALALARAKAKAAERRKP